MGTLALILFLAVFAVSLAADNMRAGRRLMEAEARYSRLLGDFAALSRSMGRV